jgi:hypothetical protein
MAALRADGALVFVQASGPMMPRFPSIFPQEQPFNANVFIEIWPVQAKSRTADLHIGSLRWGAVG